MKLIKGVMIAFLLLNLVACKPKPPAQSLDDITDRSGSTIYDANSPDGSVYGSNSGTLEDDTIESEDFIPTIDDETIDSVTRLDEVDYNSPDLDWTPIFFDFDRSELSDDAKRDLADRAEILKNYPNLSVLLEGHADSRGTEEYNLALGERRAQAVKRYFLQLGVSESRLKTMSYGEMRPLVPSDSESAWSRNRRVSFTF